MRGRRRRGADRRRPPASTEAGPPPATARRSTTRGRGPRCRGTRSPTSTCVRAPSTTRHAHSAPSAQPGPATPGESSSSLDVLGPWREAAGRWRPPKNISAGAPGRGDRQRQAGRRWGARRLHRAVGPGPALPPTGSPTPRSWPPRPRLQTRSPSKARTRRRRRGIASRRYGADLHASLTTPADQRFGAGLPPVDPTRRCGCRRTRRSHRAKSEQRPGRETPVLAGQTSQKPL